MLDLNSPNSTRQLEEIFNCRSHEIRRGLHSFYAISSNSDLRWLILCASRGKTENNKRVSSGRQETPKLARCDFACCKLFFITYFNGNRSWSFFIWTTVHYASASVILDCGRGSTYCLYSNVSSTKGCFCEWGNFVSFQDVVFIIELVSNQKCCTAGCFSQL